MRRLIGQSLVLILILVLSCGKEERGIHISGRIEGDEYDVGTKVGGKILRILVDEGDEVRKGELLAELESEQLRARLRRALAALEFAKESLKAKRREVNTLKEKLRSLEIKRSILMDEVSLNVDVAKKRKEIALKEIERLRHRKEELSARYRKIKRDLERYRDLHRKGVVPKSKLEEMETQERIILERLKAMDRSIGELVDRLSLAELELRRAESRRREVSVLGREIRALRETLRAKERELSAFRSKVKEAQALVEEIEAHLKDTEIRAPAGGVIVEKMVEEGEVVAPGQRLFTIVNLDRLYFKGYLPETKLGMVSLGQKAFIVVDSFPDRKFPAVVSYISDRAEFTPKEVQTKEARVKQVFAVKLRLKENPQHLLKPGMPAEAYIERR